MYIGDQSMVLLNNKDWKEICDVVKELQFETASKFHFENWYDVSDDIDVKTIIDEIRKNN